MWILWLTVLLYWDCAHGVKTEEYWSTRWRLLEEIKLIFDEEGIEIPFNQLTVHMAEK